MNNQHLLISTKQQAQLDLFAKPKEEPVYHQPVNEKQMQVVKGKTTSRFTKSTNGRFRKRKRVKQADPGFPKFCQECNISVDCQTKLDAHNRGKVHQKNLRKKDLLETYAKKGVQDISKEKYIVVSSETKRRMCTLCSVEFSSTFIELSHIQGRRHKQNVQNASKGVPLIRPRPKKKRKPNKATILGRCEICNVTYTSLLMKKNHVVGKIHLRNCKAQGIPVHTSGKSADNNASIVPVLGPQCLLYAGVRKNIKKTAKKPSSTTVKKPAAQMKNNTSVKKVNTMIKSNKSWSKKPNIQGDKNPNNLVLKKNSSGITSSNQQLEEPLSKKQKPNATQNTNSIPETIRRELEALSKMEAAAEEFFQNYKKVVISNPYRAGEMYRRYEALYESYEAAYESYVRSYCTPCGAVLIGS